MKVFEKLSVFIIITAILAGIAVFPSSAKSVVRPIAYFKTAVYVRSGAGTGYKAVAVGKKNAKLKLYSGKKYNKLWYKVRYKGHTGYVHKKYLKFPKGQLFISPKGTVYAGYKAKFSTLFNTTKQKIKWTSSDKSIAVINSKGVISPKKKGRITITAMAGRKTVKSVVTVKNATVKFSSGTGTMLTDSRVALNVRCKKPLTWHSSDTSIATVVGGVAYTKNKTGTFTVTAKSKSGSAKCVITVKQRVLKLAADKATAYTGCHVKLTATNGAHGYAYSSSNTKAFTVDKRGIATAVAAGKSTITVTSGALSAKVNLTAKNGSAVNISHKSAQVKEGMTHYVKSKTSGVKWYCSDSNLASVSKGFTETKAKGIVLVQAYTSKGAADCVITIDDAEPVRFAYTSENSAAKNSNITFYAITDTRRASVKFKITYPSGAEHWLSSASHSSSNGRIIWKADKKLSDAGTYKINAYSKIKGKSWLTSDGGAATVFVNPASDLSAPTTYEKRASTALLKDIAYFEGYVSSVAPDKIVADSPTVGYGNVVYAGSSFYNGMTKDEAFAYLVKTVNESGYNSRVNKILSDNKIYCNQNQFDALVDFSYNLGVYAITNHDELIGALKDTYGKASYADTGFINASGVVLRKEADDGSASVKTLKAGTYVTITSKKNSWYEVKLSDDKTKGFIKQSRLVLRTTDAAKRNLNNLSLDSMKLFLKYHHASSTCYKGLLYRRVDELEMFMFKDYTCDGKSNKFGIKYTCPTNSSFTFG
jgi:GH24 family phage-related lysozyme (muramidase)/uncharacterized protein YjdB